VRFTARAEIFAVVACSQPREGTAGRTCMSDQWGIVRFIAVWLTVGGLAGTVLFTLVN
jgi:hypothetical protein